MSLPDRYHRQRILPEIDDDGQARLANARAIVVGLGALGSTVAESLARAGVGSLRLIDRDIVELTNLQRQSLYSESDAAERTPKAIAASRRLGLINSEIRIEPVIADVGPADAVRVLGIDEDDSTCSQQVIIDCTDNFDTRYLLNDVCVKHGIPLVYGGVVGVSGRTLLIEPSEARGPSACLRCVFPEPPEPGSQPTCDTAGVLGPAASIVGARQAVLAIRSLIGSAEVSGSLWSFDAWNGRAVTVRSERDNSCPCCAEREFEFLDGPEQRATSLCGVDAVQVRPRTRADLDLEALSERLKSHGEFQASPYLIRGRLLAEQDGSGGEIGLTIFKDGRAIVTGVEEESKARALYARYVGA